MGRGWDFDNQPASAHVVVDMYARDPPSDPVARRHYLVARASLAKATGEGRMPVKVGIEQIRLTPEGYDRGGAYWGCGAPLWYAHSDNGAVDIWERAVSRDAVKALVLARYPQATFYR